MRPSKLDTAAIRVQTTTGGRSGWAGVVDGTVITVNLEKRSEAGWRIPLGIMPSMPEPQGLPSRSGYSEPNEVPRGPWRETLRTLRERFSDDHLGLTAGSLTFTTLISLVPLVTVMLALFSAFPIFGQLQDALNRFLVQSVVPEAIARPVLNAVTQFASKASRLGVVGLLAFIGTAIALMLTIDRTLNGIWRVKTPRPLAQRVLVYWATLTLGPVVLGASLWFAASAMGVSRGWLENDWPAPLRDLVVALFRIAEFVVLITAFATFYRLVPNTHVRWRHAAAGGFLAALGFVLAKAGLALYLESVPTFSVVYGAFATVPILLTWIYLVWVVILLGAVVSAHAPMLMSGLRRRPAVPGLDAVLALECLAWLESARSTPQAGLSRRALAARMAADPLQVESVLDELVSLGWVGRLDEDGDARQVLLCDPSTTSVAPWFDRLLVGPSAGGAHLRQSLQPEALKLADVLPRGLVQGGETPPRWWLPRRRRP